MRILLWIMLLILVGCSTSDGVLKQQAPGAVRIVETNGKSPKLFLNGTYQRSLENGTLLLSGISQGEQELVLFAPGYALAVKPITLTSGDTVDVEVTMEAAANGDINIQSDSGSVVVVGDLTFGTVGASGSLDIEGLPIGEYLITISNGSKSQDSTISLSDGDDIALQINLMLQQRILIEHFSNVSCDYCPIHAETMYHILDSMGWKNISKVSYNAAWPAKDDPLHLFDPKFQTDRTMFYGSKVNYALPMFVVNGEVISFNSDGKVLAAKLKELIVREKAKSPLFDISLSESMVTVKSLSNEDFRGTLYVHLVQDKVEFETAPGTNGETHFFNAYRRNSLEEKLELKKGETKNFDFSVDTSGLPSSGLRLTTFIQTDTDTIMQTTDLKL